MAEFGKLNFAVAFNPQTAFPLDARYYFDNYDAAETAAQGAVEIGSASGTYFFGQTVVVVESSVATLYVIQPDKTLRPVGSTPLGDGKSITVVDGKVQLAGFAEAKPGQQPRIGAGGSLEWYTPDASTVEGLQQTVGQLQTDVTQLQSDVGTINDTLETKANVSDVYTQTQTDEKIAAAISSTYKPSGSVEFASLPTPSADNLGNVYNVTDAFTAGASFIASEQGTKYPAGTNVVVVEVDDAYYYDALTGIVDLSSYATKTWVNGQLQTQSENLIGNESGVTADTIQGAVVEAKGYADGLNTAMDGRVDALETNVGGTPVATQIQTAIQALDKADRAVANQFVTSVSETDGVVTVTRARPQIADVQNLQSTLDNKVDTSSLADIATTGNVNDLIQTPGDWIVFNCGSSTVNI